MRTSVCGWRKDTVAMCFRVSLGTTWYDKNFGLIQLYCNNRLLGMKPKVVVEQLESYEDIWDNNILQLPTILSSPSLDCSQQYKSWTSDETVSCLVQMDPQLEASVTVKGGCHHVSKQVKYAPQCTRKRFRKVQYHHSLKFANNSNSKIPKNNLVEHTNPFLRTSALSDPFDDFITLNDTQQLLSNCNVFNNLSALVAHRNKSPLSSPSSFARSILRYRGSISCTVPHCISDSWSLFLTQIYIQLCAIWRTYIFSNKDLWFMIHKINVMYCIHQKDLYTYIIPKYYLLITAGIRGCIPNTNRIFGVFSIYNIRIGYAVNFIICFIFIASDREECQVPRTFLGMKKYFS